MTTPPHWRQTLEEVERSIGDCLETLDRYEAAFARILADAGPLPQSISHDSSTVWDAKLDMASQTADDVERLLAEQDGVWNRWRETLASWRGLIEQPA
jgi:hypothetical protein